MNQGTIHKTQPQPTQSSGSGIVAIAAGLSATLLAAQYGSGQAEVAKIPQKFEYCQTNGTFYIDPLSLDYLEFHSVVTKIVTNLLENEVKLDEDASSILRSNLWDLYL